MEQQFRDTVSRLEGQLSGSQTAADIAKRFVDGLGPDHSARFNDHSITLASRVLTHMMHSCLRKKIDCCANQSWFGTRPALVGKANSDTELGALFKASCATNCVPVKRLRLCSNWQAKARRRAYQQYCIVI
jgi:hypothetical protein